MGQSAVVVSVCHLGVHLYDSVIFVNGCAVILQCDKQVGTILVGMNEVGSQFYHLVQILFDKVVFGLHVHELMVG